MGEACPIDNRRRRITAGSLFAVSVFFLSNTLQVLTDDGGRPSATEVAIQGFIALATAVFMIASILGLAHLLHKKADWIGLVGATSALLGWMAATRMSSIFQLNALVRTGVENVPTNAIDLALKSAPPVWGSIFPPGIFFPLGLITLGIALFRYRPVMRWNGLLLAVGGVLFPIGRAANVLPAVIACDLVLATAFALIGWRLVTRPDLWQDS